MSAEDLINCSRLGRTLEVMTMIEGGWDVNVKEEYLLRQGADPNLSGTWVVKCLLTEKRQLGLDSVALGSVERTLFDIPLRLPHHVGSDVNAQTFHTDTQFQIQLITPLHLACLSRDLELCRYLVKHGAHTNLLDSEGKAPYDPANCGEDFSNDFQVEFCREEEDVEMMVEDLDSPNSLASEYRAALEKIESLSTNLIQEREFRQELEEENRDLKLMIEELKSSHQHEINKITEERKRDTETFNQFEEASRNREQYFLRAIEELERLKKKKSEKIHRLQASIAHINRSTPVSSYLSPQTPSPVSLAGPGARRAVSPQPPAHSDDETHVFKVPTTRSPLTSKEHAETHLLPLRHLSPNVRSPMENPRTPDPNTTPKKMTPPKASPSLASTAKTPRYIRDLDLSPTSKSRALLSTPNTVQAAHAMSLLSFPQPFFPLASEEQRYELTSQDSEEGEGVYFQRSGNLGSTGRELKRKEGTSNRIGDAKTSPEQTKETTLHHLGRPSYGGRRLETSKMTTEVPTMQTGSFPSTPSSAYRRRVATISEVHDGLD